LAFDIVGSAKTTKELIDKYSDQILNGVFHGDIIAKWSADDVTDGYTVKTADYWCDLIAKVKGLIFIFSHKTNISG